MPRRSPLSLLALSAGVLSTASALSLRATGDVSTQTAEQAKRAETLSVSDRGLVPQARGAATSAVTSARTTAMHLKEVRCSFVTERAFCDGPKRLKGGECCAPKARKPGQHEPANASGEEGEIGSTALRT
jgi:hypothetical protein